MPEKPLFPIIIFMAAAMKDMLLDPLILGATLVLIPLGWMLGIFISMIYTGIFFLWFLFKPFEMRKGKLMFKYMVRLALAFGISFIPFARVLVPEMTLVVWFTYRAEVKEWQKTTARVRQTLAAEFKQKSAQQRHAAGQIRKPQRKLLANTA